MTAGTTRGRRHAARKTTKLHHAGRYLAVGSVMALLMIMGARPSGQAPVSTKTLVITEVNPGGSSASYLADWFEVTNVGMAAVDITNWKVDDSSAAFATAVALRGVTSIPAGKSAIFVEANAGATNDAAIIASFSTAWFGSPTPPAGVIIGLYGGSGIGLSATTDGVNLWDASGSLVTGVAFGATTAGRTFDNTAGLRSATAPFPTISTPSIDGVNGAFTSTVAPLEVGSPGRTITRVDLSTYHRVGRFNLPEPTRTTPPANSVLAQEVSAVTYNWDTNTLFVVGDGGTSIVQVTKAGTLINSMTLAPGGSPQGTDFYDPEGLTYVGGGKFVMVEERDRQAVLFTYAPGIQLTRADAQTVKLGTFKPNIGIEGITYDPLTGEFVAVKEIDPMGIFQTGIDFAAGTATNGSPTTENSTNLFNPAPLGLLDFADVFSLSNLPVLGGQTDFSHLLVLSQESGKILNVDRSGNVLSSLSILSDLDNALSIPDQQHEGLTMDSSGFLYVVSENGGGDIDHPQLWVYAPASAPNQAPTGMQLSNVVNSIAENSDTALRVRMANIVITDDGLGTNVLSVTGPDAAFFEADNTGLYIKAGTVLDFEAKDTYSVTVVLDDPTAGATPDATADYAMTVTDVVGEAPPVPTILVSEVAPWSSGNAPVNADWFEVTNTGNSAVSLTDWRFDDANPSFNTGVVLNGVPSIAPGESVIFLDTSTGDPATIKAAFLSNWFGASSPVGLQVGTYAGAGIGLSTGGDAVNLYNSAGVLQASVTFGTASTGPVFASFDNALGLNATAITQLSVPGINGAFVAATNLNQVGSPGTVGRVFISEVAAFANDNSPLHTDWFELTNGTAHPLDITGWKVDDSGGSPAASAPLTGVTLLAPGESVIFIETATPLDATFKSLWFGDNAPAALQVGSYTGNGLGLSAGGDGVTIFNGVNVLRASVTFGASPNSAPFATFDNAAGRNATGISQLSAVGVRGAFTAINSPNEVGSPGTIFDTTDDDRDTILDGADNCPLVANTTQTDSDADGIGDACDTDDDNDTILDTVDNCTLVGNTDQVDDDGDGLGNPCDPDDDNDTIADAADNCPIVANTTQANGDGDALGDACDGNPNDGPSGDLDTDSILNNDDNCPSLANPNQLDTDHDGIGDACDPDDDNDAVLDAGDNCPLVANADQANADGDTAGDACDANPSDGPAGDRDGDGRINRADNCPLVANRFQVDSDRDGLGDACDPTPKPNLPPICWFASAAPSRLWPPDHKLVRLAINGVWDLNGDPLKLKILSIFQDEPTNGGNDGNTAIDGFGVGSSEAWVRAERSGFGDGRVYYVKFSATDPSGASCTRTVTVGVPRFGFGQAIGGGPNYDSTRPGAVTDNDEHHDCGESRDHNHDRGRQKDDHNRKFHGWPGGPPAIDNRRFESLWDLLETFRDR